MEDFNEFDDLNVVLAAAWVWGLIVIIVMAFGYGIEKVLHAL